MISKWESSAGIFALGAVCIAVPLVAGLISAKMSGDQMSSFGELNQPPLSPPGWIFPIVWTILYILMGIALFLIIRSGSEYKVAGIALFISQLIMNVLWSPMFFVRQDYVTAFIILVLMWITTAILAIVSMKINMIVTYLLIPYLAWMTFAGYLNAGVGMLNS